MDGSRFDRMATALAGGNAATRRAVVGGLLASLAGLVVVEGTSAKKKGKKRCKKSQTRCQGRCVNMNTDRKNCGSCGNACPSGTFCLNGLCYSDDICPAQQKACPNFVRCGSDDGRCFCGTTTGERTVCFQDEFFCDTPRPCQTTDDCDDGRVCIDSSDCCAEFDLPDVPRTCVLPCEQLTEPAALAGKSARQHSGGQQGPGRGSREPSLRHVLARHALHRGGRGSRSRRLGAPTWAMPGAVRIESNAGVAAIAGAIRVAGDGPTGRTAGAVEWAAGAASVPAAAG